MTDFNYKKYSLENLENWLYDAMSSGEATPQEIYDTIKNVVQEQYYHHKHYASQSNELLALLNGQGKNHISIGNYSSWIGNDNLPHPYDKIEFNYEESKNVWNNFWENDTVKVDKVVKWQLPVNVDGLTGDCYVNFPDDLLEAANLKEGDTVEWVDNNDGSYTLRKTNVTK